MTFYSFIGIAVTSATVILFGQAIWDPVRVLSRLSSPLAVVIAMIAVLMAMLNVNEFCGVFGADDGVAGAGGAGELL